MPYLTTRKNVKLQLSPGLVASYDIQKMSENVRKWTQHTSRTHTGETSTGNTRTWRKINIIVAGASTFSWFTYVCVHRQSTLWSATLHASLRPNLIESHSLFRLWKTLKKVKKGIAVCRQACHHRYGNSHATVLPATRQRWHSRLYPSQSWYSI